MLAFITDFAVPASLLVLMLIVGTDLRTPDFRRIIAYPGFVVTAALGQLAFLPLLGLLIVSLSGLEKALAVSIMILTVCPGGAISNYYCYLARSNVALSATITATTTIASLFTIPLWLLFLRRYGLLADTLSSVPVPVIFLQLLLLMVAPLGLGMLARARMRRLENYQGPLSKFSLLLVALILVSAVWTLRDSLALNFATIFPVAVLFTLSAMIFGWGLSRITGAGDAPVHVVECAARNVAVAVLVGSSVIPTATLSTFFTFLTGYFVAEMLIMIPYAYTVRPKVREGVKS